MNRKTKQKTVVDENVEGTKKIWVHWKGKTFPVREFWLTMTKQGDERHDDWIEGRDGDNVYIYPDRIVIVRKFQFSKNTWVFPMNSIAYYNYLEELEDGKPKGDNEN